MRTIYNKETGKASKHHPIDAVECLKTGAYQTEPVAIDADVDDDYDDEAIEVKLSDRMTVAELKSIAHEHEVEVDENWTKKQMINKIRDAL